MSELNEISSEIIGNSQGVIFGVICMPFGFSDASKLITSSACSVCSRSLCYRPRVCNRRYDGDVATFCWIHTYHSFANGMNQDRKKIHPFLQEHASSSSHFICHPTHPCIHSREQSLLIQWLIRHFVSILQRTTFRFSRTSCGVRQPHRPDEPEQHGR